VRELECSGGHRFPILSPFAVDILALPASEASAEWAFSHCGDLTREKRNRKKVTLERFVFVKVNWKLFQKVAVTQ